MNYNQFSQIPYMWWQLVRSYEVDGKKININHAEIALLSILDNLGKGVKDGGGYASNEYLASCINVTTRSITNYIDELQAVGLIKTFYTYEKGSRRTTTRKVYVQHEYINELLAEPEEQEALEHCSTIEQCDISTRTVRHKDWNSTTEAVEQYDISTRTRVPTNITIIQQEYNNNRTSNISTPELATASVFIEEEKVCKEVSNIASYYQYDFQGEHKIFEQILINECKTNKLDVQLVARKWLDIIRQRNPVIDIKPNGHTTPEQFTVYCKRVIDSFSNKG